MSLFLVGCLCCQFGTSIGPFGIPYNAQLDMNFLDVFTLVPMVGLMFFVYFKQRIQLRMS